jgi:hypothetical protein
MFSAVWTTITPDGAAGKRLPRLSRLPERLNPVTWQNNTRAAIHLHGRRAGRIEFRRGFLGNGKRPSGRRMKGVP